MLHTYTEAHTLYTHTHSRTHTCTIGDLKWVPNRNPQKLFLSSQAENIDAYFLMLCVLFFFFFFSLSFYLFVLFLSIHVRFCLLCFGVCVRDLFKLKLCRVIGLELSSVSVFFSFFFLLFFILCFFFVIVSSHALENACFKCVCVSSVCVHLVVA